MAPDLIAAYHHFGCNESDLIVMAVNISNTNLEVSEFNRQLGIEYPTISGPDGGDDIIPMYQVTAFPTIMLIDPSGLIHQNPYTYHLDTLENQLNAFGVAPQPCSPSKTAKIFTYAIPEQTDPPIFENQTIEINLLPLTQEEALVPTFTLSYGAWAEIDGVTQISNVTPVDFTSGSVIYTINAEDSLSTNKWLVTVHGGVSIESINESQSAYIYPNPATDVINITNASKLTIINSLGQIVKITENETQVNVQDLNNGIYTVQIENNNQIMKEILIINR